MIKRSQLWVTFALFGSALTAISCVTPDTSNGISPTSTVDLDATVRARVEATSLAERAFETAVAEAIVATADAIPTPTVTPEPTATPTPIPTKTPSPTPTTTPNLIPTLKPELPGGLSNQDAIDFVRAYLSTKTYKPNFIEQNCLSALELSSHRWEANPSDDAWLVSILLNQPWFGVSSLSWKYNTRLSVVTPLTQVNYWPDPFQPMEQVTYC